MAKSLKKFFQESLVSAEIKKWSIPDCFEYLDKHKKDKKQSPTLKMKIKLVEQAYKKKLHKISYKECSDYLREYTSNLEKSISFEEFINDVKSQFVFLGIKEKNPKLRKEALKYSDLTLSDLKIHAPLQCQDPKDVSLQAYQKNTGIYLWKIGYEVDKFLGAGGFGVVWKVGNKAIKVTCGGMGPINSEIIAAKELQELLKKDKTGKASKYLNLIKHKGGNIFKAPLAKGDLLEEAGKKHGETGSKMKPGKTIETILRKARQSLKAVKIMHDAGYSHNDIKPQNFLKIDNFKSAQKKYEDGKKQHKSRIQLGDFGVMSVINSTTMVAGTRGYAAPDVKDCSAEAVAKRDVYSLGVTFLFFLLKNSNFAIKVASSGVISPDKICADYKLEELYAGTSKANITAFLYVIGKMLSPSYKQRISVDDALNLVKKLKSGQ